MSRALAIGISVVAVTVATAHASTRQDMTITVYPSIAPLFEPVVVSGRAPTPRAGELVTVEGRECGVPGGVFRGVAAAQTTNGGGWSVEYRPRTKTELRAVWGKDVSREVTVEKRPLVTLVPRSGGVLRVTVYGVPTMVGKRVTIERLDAKSRTWRAVRTVRLRSDYGELGEAVVRLKVPKGTTVRATLPLPQSKPCYLPGTSTPVRT